MSVVRLRQEIISLAGAMVVVVLVADFATKLAMIHLLDRGQPRWLIDNWAGLELTENRGIAFGIGEGSPAIIAFVLVGLVALVLVILRSESWATRPLATGALGAAAGGGIANVVDRVPDGAVTDFIVLGPWPRFNIADSALTIGLILLAYLEVKREAAQRA